MMTGKPDGTAKLYSESIDNGSYDNCSAVRLEIRRVNKGVKSDNVTTDAPSCGNLGNGNHNTTTISLSTTDWQRTW
ncbi:MAG: hypothetical protein IPN89_10890 [Saprospiraceae bacterium]|nr:hypothetical protein [Saprospiraceae bacterium]